MKKYVIIAETGSDITKEMADKYGIYLVPMHVSFGSETKDDGSFSIEELFEYYEKTGDLPKTSASMPVDFEKVFDEIHEKMPQAHIIHLAYSKATTCSYQNAIIAAEGRDYVTSIDTKHVSAGQAIIVYAMAKYLEDNPQCTIKEIKAKVEQLAVECKMGFFPGDLAYLKAGGRVSNAAYIGAKLLNITPLIEVIDGTLQGTKKYHGSTKRIAKSFFKDFVTEKKLKKDQIAYVNALGLDDKVKKLLEELAIEYGFQDILWVSTGGVISSHSGPGGFGIAGFSE